MPDPINPSIYTSGVQQTDPMKTFSEIAGASSAMSDVQIKQRALLAQTQAAAAIALATDPVTHIVDTAKLNALATDGTRPYATEGLINWGIQTAKGQAEVSNAQSGAQTSGFGVMSQIMAPLATDPNIPLEDRRKRMLAAVTNGIQHGVPREVGQQLTAQISDAPDNAHLTSIAAGAQSMGLTPPQALTVQTWTGAGGVPQAAPTQNIGATFTPSSFPPEPAAGAPGSPPAVAPPAPGEAAPGAAAPGVAAPAVPAPPASPAPPPAPVQRPATAAGLSPGDVETQKGEASAFNNLQAAAADVPSRKSILSNILLDQKGIASGAGSPELNELEDTIVTTANFLTGNASNPQKLTQYQVLTKQTAAYVAAVNKAAGAGGLGDTDMERMSQAMSNANPAKMGNDAIKYVVHLAQGAEDGLALKSRLALQYVGQPDATGKRIGFNQVQNWFNQHYDSRVMALPYMSQPEQENLIRGLQEDRTTYQSFSDNYNYALQQGWIKPGSIKKKPKSK